jgi:hypothetical protein
MASPVLGRLAHLREWGFSLVLRPIMNAIVKQMIYKVRRRAPSHAKPYSPVAEFHGAAQDSG